MSVALEAYLHLKRGAQQVSPYVPFATAPFAASSAFARMLMGGLGSMGLGGWGEPASSPAPPVAAVVPPPPPPAATHDEVAAMRRELDELKRSMGKSRRPRG